MAMITPSHLTFFSPLPLHLFVSVAFCAPFATFAQPSASGNKLWNGSGKLGFQGAALEVLPNGVGCLANRRLRVLRHLVPGRPAVRVASQGCLCLVLRLHDRPIPVHRRGVHPPAATLRPVQQACLEANRAGLAGAPGVSAGPPDKILRSLSLFSGCGALDYALPWCSPAAFCEKDPGAAAVLRARMADGCLPKAPLYNDVRTLTEKELTTRIDVIVAGFPCVDVSKAGRKLGLDGSESTLVWEVVRLVRALGVPMLFLENVDHFRFMPKFWTPVLVELLNLGFQIRWISLSCTHIGSPQRRRRVFLLARRGEALLKPFAPLLHRGCQACLRTPSRTSSGGIRVCISIRGGPLPMSG